MSRDPKVEPRFGDVFRFGPNLTVMFVAGNLTDWTALEDDGGLTDGYVGVGDPGWKFVEHIDATVIGGLLPWQEAILRRSGIDPANLTAEGLRVVRRMMYP